MRFAPLQLSSRWCSNFYRSHTKYGEGNVFTPVCHSVHRGVWLGRGVCLGREGGLPWERRGFALGRGLHADPPQKVDPTRRQTPPPEYSHPGNTVNTWSVHILLECILVGQLFGNCSVRLNTVTLPPCYGWNCIKTFNSWWTLCNEKPPI